MILRTLDYIYREIVEYVEEWSEDAGNILPIPVDELEIDEVTEEFLNHILDFKIVIAVEHEDDKLNLELDANVLYSSYCSRVDQSQVDDEMQYQEYMTSRGLY